MNLRNLVLPCALVLALGACGGTKLVKKAAPPPQREQPLVVASDASLTASIDWVIVRNGPGAWAKNADWDEYLLRVRNTSSAPLQIRSILVTDSTRHDAGTLDNRKQLVKASKQTAKRYRKSGMKVMAGRGGGTLVVAGVGTTVFGAAAVIATTPMTFLGPAAGAGGAGATAAGAILIGGPVLIGMGIARAVNNHKVADRIETRATPLPLSLAAGTDAVLDVFFPLAPSPQRVTLHYSDAQGEHQLEIDTGQVLAGLHLPAPKATPTATATP